MGLIIVSIAVCARVVSWHLKTAELFQLTVLMAVNREETVNRILISSCPQWTKAGPLRQVGSGET